MCINASAKKTTLFVIFFLLMCPPLLMAMDISLEWDPNTEPNLAGYRLFVREAGESYYYSHPEWEGADTRCTIRGLDEYESYFFVVRAFDTEGNESGNSNEVFLPSPHGSHRLNPGTDGYASAGGGGGCFISSSRMVPGGSR